MVNWQNIDNVLLDMDGTLLDLSFDNYFWLEFLPQKISDHKTISLEEATKTVPHFLNPLMAVCSGIASTTGQKNWRWTLKH